MPGKTARPDRATRTQERILGAAERLFAEHGIAAVSNRQISEAAGQGNNAAVNYHFGTKADLVRALVRRYNEAVEARRTLIVAAARGSTETRDWIACLVRPLIDHLNDLGSPTWYARFAAQLTTDPALREIITEESLSSPSMVEAIDGLNRCLSSVPAEVRVGRGEMARQLIVHMIAEYERALAAGLPTPWATWNDVANALIDAIAGLWHAPISSISGQTLSNAEQL